MIKRLFLLYVGLVLLIVNSSCNPRTEFIYELNVGNPLRKAIRVDITALGTELDAEGKNVTSAVLNFNITNIGAQDVELSHDIQINLVQQGAEMALKRNTVIEGKILEPHNSGSYEISFNVIQTGIINVVFEVDGESKSFVMTTTYPAQLLGNSH